MFRLDDKIDFQAKTNDILTVGELLIDMISTEYDSSTESKAYQRYFGGSPSNIAMNTKKLGIHSLVASAVGEDGFGKFLINQLQKEKIDTSCVQGVGYSTSMVVVNKSKTTPIPIFYRGADYHLAYTSKLEEAVIQSKIIHFSCWPISMPPSRYTIEKVIELAKQNDILIGFDPNYHPMIWQNGEEGVEYVKSIISKTDIIKPSEDDAERLFGKDTHDNQITKFLNLGAKLVIMTLGKDGAIVSNGVETIKCQTLADEIVDTTGAGDAFWSGFYSAVVKGYTIREALTLGFAVSAFKLKSTGAVVNLPRLEEIKQIYNL
jgi:sugar/nucleoside kinase (ribokinase family)